MDQITRTQRQLGSVLSGYRKAKGLTQEALSSRVRLRQATISAIENAAANTRLDSVFRLLAALNLEIVVRPRTKGSTKDFERIF